MNYFKTKLGKKFIELTIPRIAESIGKLTSNQYFVNEWTKVKAKVTTFHIFILAWLIITGSSIFIIAMALTFRSF